MPDRRPGYTQKFRVGGQTGYLRTGEYADGTLGEIFLTLSKQGSTLQGVLNSLAISISLGLQYGVPLEEFISAFRDARFEPNGPVARHPKIKFASSIIDLVVRDLEDTYLQAGNAKPAECEVPGQGVESKALPTPESAKVNPTTGYSGNPCSTCGEFKLVRTGACYCCQACGSSSGCS
jgi:ribonucleoside-diphosphate reductase alpha chain